MLEENYAERAFQEALALLEQGEHKQAKEHFSALLAQESENLEFQSGFYCTGWWLNRKDSRQLYRSGRALAFWLMQEWKEFSGEAKKRGYQGCLCYRKTMQFILGEASDNFRKAFQEEGASSADLHLLKELAACLMQMEDYANACDILQYARTKAPQDAYLCFLLGEVLCCLDGEKHVGRGLSCYRDAFLADLRVLDPDWIASPIASKTFMQLHEKTKGNIEHTRYWFPAYLMNASFLYSLRPLKDSESEHIFQEIERLNRERERDVAKYRERVNAALSFYLLVFIYQKSITQKSITQESTTQKNITENSGELIHAYKEKLNEVAPHLYKSYIKNS